ncbi:protein ROLLING AND ERECT LEAF 2 isoform X2 [Jatropha curcas]|uniref:protein ROLLING AND ERECT LEAF 2 isoform X2 n=1 Tax=Jatropha curcas TaxID=180498 RepID=UPI0005FBF04F|nr:protein ROLLING AND ERECT LEAF 2 isoform X2 [Jatropha curcas]
MGCGLSKQDEEDDVVSLCRERKRLLKLALQKRYAFADAQFKYNQSLYAVAMALRLFVARHSSLSSPFLITFPSNTDSTNLVVDSNETLNNNPCFLQQRPTEPIHETIARSTNLETKVEGTHEDKNNANGDCEEQEEESEESEDGEEFCQHFYGQENVDPVVSSLQRQFGWDFFYPFDEMRSEVLNELSQSSYEDLKAVREKEGIPDLEEDGEKLIMNKIEVVNEKKNGDVGNNKENGIEDFKTGDNASVSQEESKGLKVIDTPTNGRELLEALKDIEDHFLRAYESGLDISRMLEANRIHLQSGLEEIKESSTKLIRSITWNRSNLSRSSSSRSLLTSSSANSSMWTELKTDLFDDFGMEAGSHSLTLSRLYAWEKKLYQEVKAGDQTRKMYQRKCSHLRGLNGKGEDFCSMDKSTAQIKELHSRISVTIRSVESISNRIEKLRDEELQPQLLELLHGLMRNWKLEAELDNWRVCFAMYLSSQKAYVESLSGWLSKFVAPEVEFYSRGKTSIPPFRISGPPLLLTCHGWLAWLDKLPDNSVTYAMKNFERDIHSLWNQQGKEQKQKRKVEGIAKELDRRALAFQSAERRILGSKISEQESEASVRNRIEYLAEGKKLLDMFRNRLNEEKGKHLNTVQETQQITVSGFQTGFSSVFESLVEFSNASVKMYADLVTYSANAKEAEKVDDNLSYMDGMFS